ncbi:MAG: hypothetical protein JWR80_10066 [Bradyrhizobium sp.]|nr:hypothetical protein [Bradyrhizobium sp.]
MAKKSGNRLIGTSAPSISGPNAAQERRWRAEEDIRTLTRAAEIKADTARLNAAKALATKQVNDLKKACK